MDSAISSSLVNNKQQLFLQQCSPVFVEYRLMREFVLFQQQNLSHIYIIPSASSAFKWYGVMFIHYGLYHGAILRFTMTISSSFPECDCPKIIFDPIPFHPLISPITGELNTSKAFPDWKSNTNQLWHVILFAKRVFHTLDMDFIETIDPTSSSVISPFNAEAAQMYKNDFESFERKISQTIGVCNDKMNDSPKDGDPHFINFGHWNPDIHEELRFKLLAGVNVIEEMQSSDPIHPSATGLSWVQKGTMQMFSKSGA